jgi:hypothetical protein
MTFRFSLIDSNFKIEVNGSAISVNDLKKLSEATQFIWPIDRFSDEFLKNCINVKKTSSAPPTKLKIRGYLATVEKPSHLKVRGSAGDERATVDLFVNGRLREKNLIRHFPTQRIAESYLYGQIHFDEMDGDGDSPFTSSREGVVESNSFYMALCDYMRKSFLPHVIDQWDEFRLELGRPGDDENPRKTKRERGASNLVSAAEDEYVDKNARRETQDKVEEWLKSLRGDAEFNVSAYVDCFLSENLVRKYIAESGKAAPKEASTEMQAWKSREVDRKNEAGISFDIRKSSDDSSYLGMDHLAIWAEGSKTTNGKPSLWRDAINFRPVRNAVGHTGILTKNAKNHLNMTFENIKARIKILIK